MGDKLGVWLESLSVRQADGTWLVQAPATGSWVPLIYSLPDDAARRAYVDKARQVGRPHQLVTVAMSFTYLLMAGPMHAIPLRFGVSPSISAVQGLVFDLLLLVLWTSLVLLACRAASRQEEALHAWLAKTGSLVDARSGQAGAKGMVLRGRQEMADGWHAMRPTWMFAVEMLVVGISVVLFLLALVTEPMRCSRWNEGFTLFGVCLTGIGLMWLAMTAFVLGIHGWRWHRWLRQRAALRGGHSHAPSR